MSAVVERCANPRPLARLMRRGLLLTVAALATTANVAGAQVQREAQVSWRTGIVTRSWTFATPLDVDSGMVERVWQRVVPFAIACPLSSHWRADVAGGWATGEATIIDAQGGRRALSLRGLTDVKLRVVGRFVGDAITVTAGVNAPTGHTQLSRGEASALRIVGAPMLRMPAPTLGNGLGTTAGIVLARRVGRWAVAVGGSYEARASYSPIDASSSGIAAAGATVSDLDPSDATHLTVGGDRLIGEHRLSLIASYDAYGADRLRFVSPGGGPSRGEFRLGPTSGVAAIVDVAAPGYQSLVFSIANRHRAEFSGLDGAKVQGSSGNSLDVQFRARRGRAQRAALVFGADLQFDTGLAVEESLASAASSGLGGILGVAIPLRGLTLEPAAQLSLGKIDTGAQRTRGRAFALSIGITPR